jgi:hypothetical protein
MITSNGYVALSGTRRGFIRRASAWMADDHILLITGTRFHERYARVYYRDMQGLIIQRGGNIPISWFWIVLAAVSAAIGAVQLGAWGLLIGAFALIVPLGLGAGFGCRLYIATAVGNVQVQSVTKTWQVSRFSAMVRVRAEEARPS